MKIHLTIYLLILINNSACIWPRAYKVDLNEKRTFDLTEEISSDDEDDIMDPDDEMIKATDLEQFNIQDDNEKHYRVHQVVLRRNKKSNDDTKKFVRNNYQLNETNVYDYIDEGPLVGEYVDQNGTRLETGFENVGKRMANDNAAGEGDEDYDVNYDYAKFKAEYDSDEKNIVQSNKTYNYTDVKEEESVNDALKVISDFKEAKNCTEEEMRGIGVNAAKCFWKDLHTKDAAKNRTNLIKRILIYTGIWIAIYIVIAIPCWCQYGWCCCCCICKICYPQERMDEVKKFIVDNPVGVYNEGGVRYKYTPTIFERYSQKKLEKAIMKL